jgi:di/tricarboxylate transporter
MDMQMQITFITLAVTAAFFVWGKIRSDVVALCSILVLVFTNILSVEEALSGFAAPIVIMMVALFVVGGGIFQTGLAKTISTKILHLAGNSEKKLFILVMLVTALIGSFVSNTGTVALMLPIVVSLATAANTDSRRLLMPLAFASSMGGMMTLIGTPPNLIIHGILEENTGEGLKFFSFLPVGIITLTVGIILLWPMSKLLVSKTDKDEKRKSSGDGRLAQLSQQYQLAQNLYRLRVNLNSDMVNKMLLNLSITERFNVTILEIRRDQHKRFHKTVNQNMAGPGTTIRVNDILYVLGAFPNVEKFATENNLTLIDAGQAESRVLSVSETGGMDFGEIGIAELVLLSNSKLVNKKIKDSNFRNLYNVNILGIQRHDDYILKNIKEEKMYAGDVLLIQGKWDDIHKLNQEESEWVVVGQPMEEAAKVPLSHKAPIAAIIMVAMVVVMAAGWVHPVIATMVAAILMVLTGCLRNVESAYKTINWESIVLFAAMIPFAKAMENTGAASLISNGIVSTLEIYGPVAVLAGIYLATSFITLFISNTATAVLFAPIAYQSAVALEVSPIPFLFAVAVGASMCFASPFSTPPNALVMSAGRYKFMDYVKIGLPLQLIYAVVMLIALPLLFPF